MLTNPLLFGPVARCVRRVLRPAPIPGTAPSAARIRRADPEALLIQGSIARRYARALIEVAGGDYERVGAEVHALAGALFGTSGVAEALLRPGVAKEARERALNAVLQEAGVSTTTANFLRLLLDRRRLDLLPDIARAYGTFSDERAGRLRATVTAAQPLPEPLVAQLTRRLSEATKKNVAVETTVDRSLLGGVVAQVGNVVYDGSLRTQLAILRRELTGES
jgi:F-type H+-transporting ATPase subunit delta